MKGERSDPRYWKQFYRWFGALAAGCSLLLALGLSFCADHLVRLLGVGGEPITWTQLCGELLILISVFYVPALVDVDRFRPHAWIGAVVSHGTIFLLCTMGVIGFGAPKPFLLWAAMEFFFGGVQIFQLTKLEQAENGRTVPPNGGWDGQPRVPWKPVMVVAAGDPDGMACWRRAYFWLVWLGIAANLIFVLPLVFVPHWMLRQLGVSAEPVLWAQMGGLLLGLISVFYIPAARDPLKYRPFAWLAIFPSRTGGVLFCTVAVVALAANEAFILGVSLDLPFAVLQTFVLCKLASVERHGKISFWRAYAPTGIAVVAAAAILSIIGWHKLEREYPQQLANGSIEEAFKYGSIGTEDAQGLPYWLWLTLPRVFPEYLPRPGGYAGLGFLWEPGSELPIGFSKRKIGFDRVGINCALCHAGSVQIPGEPLPRYYLGAPAVTADVLAYQKFLFACANDSRFNASTLMPAIARQTRLSLVDDLLYRLVLIPATRKALRDQSHVWTWTDEPGRPPWGPGRIEPFNPVKLAILHQVDPHVTVGATLGTSDMEPLWNLDTLPGRAFHWDGLNTNLTEVVDSSALGDGATPKSIPRPFLRSLQNWIGTNAAPKFPFADNINKSLLAQGAKVYQVECARCHAPSGADTGKVIPATGSGSAATDPNRAQMWTAESAAAYNNYLGNLKWKFKSFRSTDGYVNVPLDGLWLRAPYLHNGSVPTLADLLKPVAQRPAVFWRGINDYDPTNVGYVSDAPAARANGFRYDTSGRGNSNAGHEFGTKLSDPDKAALLEYLKTL